MLNSSFKSTNKKGKTFCVTVLRLIDVSTFSDTEIVVDPNFVVNWKTLDGSGVKWSNTSKGRLETPTSFNTFKPSENGKTDRK